MSKIFIIFLLIPCLAFSKGLKVKTDQCKDIPTGFLCYSQKELDELDVSQKEIFDCKTKLNACQANPIIVQVPEPKKIYEKQWYRDTVLGIIVLSAGIMIGVAANE